MNKQTKSTVTNSDSTNSKFHNKQRTLILSSRGIHAKHRHLLKDLRTLLPHTKTESKFSKEGIDEGDLVKKLHRLQKIDHIAAALKCPNILYFEVDKESADTELFLWMSKTSTGPSMRFKVENISTMNELNLIGNCLKYSRPLLHFDKTFDNIEGEDKLTHLPLIKELLTQTFSTPLNHPKSKPFFDHMFAFYYLDGRVWFRNYQIVTKQSSQGVALTGSQKHEYSLVEIGPRFVLKLTKILNGSFDGRVIFNSDSHFVSKAEVQRLESIKLDLDKQKKTEKHRKYLELRKPADADEVSSVFN
ncbi:predicted protein [Naegleria gruberi]|uniref:Predicted protein n=1 Tax=Naegleria gruberi TaxID=5762 RepID=D2VG53_NAEGR|nr:uncharacterized protein NAEGRDRAFT_33738 [Naegleria gruberi]EFC44209.1 predicted protein [Naegleria gruberi]|eukprot:XP_002676953.1 predicted protein [Naegleria gruberi strain NEG-M]